MPLFLWPRKEVREQPKPVRRKNYSYGDEITETDYRITSNKRPGRLLFKPSQKGGVYSRGSRSFEGGVYYLNRRFF